MSVPTAAEERARLWFWRIWTAVGAMVLLYAVLHFLSEPLHLLGVPLLIAGIIIYLLDPPVSWLHRHGLHRLVGTLLTYLVVGGVLGLALYLLVPLLINQTTDLVEGLPDIAVGLQNWLNQLFARFGVDTRVSFDPAAADTQDAVQRFIENNREELLSILGTAGRRVFGLLAGLIGVVLAPVIAFYALVDLPRLADGVQRLLPPGSRPEVIDVSQRILRTVGAYVRGQLLVSAFVGAATTIGMAAIGLPFWALVGTLAGVFNLIPFVGPFVGGVFGVIIALTVGGGTSQAVVVIIIMITVQQIDNHLITPSILSRTLHVHPVTIILSLAVTASLFGIPGMLVAVPVVAALKLIVMYLLVTRVPGMAHLAGDDGDAIEGIDAVSAAATRDYSLISMGRDLRSAYLRRRTRADDLFVDDDVAEEADLV